MDDDRGEIDYKDCTAKTHQESSDDEHRIRLCKHCDQTAHKNKGRTEADRFFGQQLAENIGGHKVSDDLGDRHRIGNKRR